ncbi:GTP pyrophosphokinase [Enterococcus sp. DIV0170]|uniref:GTP pyrophosphokinase n=1 Tax=Enterococcus sp. DIV0170 TaxID=2774642 RepID=UPI003F200DB7
MSENYSFQQKEIQQAQFFYECAMKECETKFQILFSELLMKNERSSIQGVSSRVKTSTSIYEKCVRKNIPITFDEILTNILDGAGVRVICSYVDDVYRIREMFLGQDDVILIKEKDFIKCPKVNGYRSLHLIVQLPVFLSNMKKSIVVEVQLRTAAMDFWASLEHELKYKSDNKDPVLIDELRICSDKANLLDCEMKKLRDRIIAFNQKFEREKF